VFLERSQGVSAAQGDEEGKDTPGGSPVPRGVPRFAPRPPLIRRRGANLPHWRVDGGTYAVTFRLADSLPGAVLGKWKAERAGIVARAEQMGRPLSELECKRLDELHSERVERWLDQGHGSCLLRDERIAAMVRDTLLHFDGTRYTLRAWCVMPNHVHAVLRTHPGCDLSRIILSWKGFSGKRAREILGDVGGGAFWQKEAYDHLVRDSADLAHQISYVLRNPAAAGLGDWPWVGRGGRGATTCEGIDGADGLP
jgi:REP element-mobilizing transposase RayT